jgi:hypothetical protein
MAKEKMTVGELIEKLKQFEPEMEVKYTLGGSCNFESISYVDTESDGYYDEDDNCWIDNEVVVIGELTW